MECFLNEDAKQYPPLLRALIKKPKKLFYAGLVLNPKDIYIAIVGTRHPSAYGKQMAQKFASELASMGFVIVSGLAYGIDGIAHEAALNHHPQKKTIGVLGSGLNHIVPFCNRPLAAQIINTGTLLTEYTADTAPHKGMFPARNRIIAGMSLATIVIEAPVKSGALITARFASELNREVFTLPANITQESSLGSNALIRDSKAHPIINIADFLNILEPHLPAIFQNVEEGKQLALPIPNLSEDEIAIYSLVKNNTLSRDEVISLSNLPASKISTILSMMELKGIIQISGSYIFTTR